MTLTATDKPEMTCDSFLNGGRCRRPSSTRRTGIFVAPTGALILLVLIAAAPRAFAQGAADYKYTQNTADSTLRSHARVDPSTLGMSLQIPLGAYPGRGGSSLPVNLYYSSKVWNVNYSFTHSLNIVPPPGDVFTVLDSGYGQHSVRGWMCSLAAPHIEWIGYMAETYEFGKPKPCAPPPTTKPCEYISRIRVYMPDGSSHELRKDDLARDARTVLDRSGTFYSVDGSKVRFEAGSNTLFLPDGSRYLFTSSATNEQIATQYIDRNGNVLSYNLNSRQWTDSVGRVINPVLPAEPDAGGQNYAYDPNRIAAGDNTYTLPGVGGLPISFHLIWKRLSNALSVNAPLRYRGDYSLNGVGNPSLPGPFLFTSQAANRIAVEDQLFDPVVLAEVVLPNGLSYKLTYNVFGEMDKVVYPTGGYERFVYDEILGLTRLTPIYVQANRGVVDHFISPSGSGIDESHWQYSATSPSPASYTVVQISPDGTRTERMLHPGLDSLSIKFGFDDVRAGMAYEERVYGFTGGPLLRRTLTQWTWDGPTSGGDASAMRDQRVAKQVEIILDTGGNALTETTAFDYDSNLNLVRTSRYDFLSLDQQTAQTGDISLMSPGTLIRKDETDYLNSNAYSDRQLIALPQEMRVKNILDQVVARTLILYDEASYPILTYPGAVTGWIDPATPARGNVTTTLGWLDTSNTFLESHAQYDQFGSPRKSWDARGLMSEIQYSSAYQYAYPTTTITPPPDPGGVCGCGSPTGLITTYQFDFSTGLATSMTDPNLILTTFAYNDPFNRLQQVIRASGLAGVKNQTTIFYDDAGHQVITSSDQSVYSDNVLKSVSIYDGLGRTVETRSYETSTSYITSMLEYDGLGRVFRNYNPYRTTADPTYGRAETTYDALGRAIRVETFNGMNTSTGAVTTAFDGTRVLVTDQAGKQRISRTNAIGQLTEVWEIKPADSATQAVSFPGHSEVQFGYRTVYLYGVLGNLINVTQGGQTRTFTYDSLSRLKSASNPESETVAYTYDANGNLETRTDARTVRTAYTYDGLNRMKTRSYSGPAPGGSTPAVTYAYDLATPAMPNSKGRLVSVSSSVSTYSYTAYDPAGRVLSCSQTTPGPTGNKTHLMSYLYNLAGGMTSEKYPSGKMVVTEYDSAGRIAGVKKDATNYYAGAASGGADAISYAAHGAISKMKVGNGLLEVTEFNSRLQPTFIKLGTTQDPKSVLQLGYEYTSACQASNNGNVMRQVITAPGLTLTQDYCYDSLNRLSSASENSGANWLQTYGYDRYGNRWVSQSVGYTLDPDLCPTQQNQIDAATNRINKLVMTGFDYDGSGNQIKQRRAGQNETLAYDAENRMTTFNGGVGQYYYDGDGHRVKKIDNNGTTVFVYNAGGQLIAEYTTASSVPPGGTSYLTTDHLGSTRVVTAQDGTVKARHDYLPFGEEIQAPTGGRTAGLGYVADTVRQKFTQKERDSESGLDYFLARYYASTQGRFSTADPLYLEMNRLTDPQQLNLYAYTRNNPLRFNDPIGLDITVSGDASLNYVRGLQDDISFQVHLNAKTNKVEIVDANGNILNKKQLKALGKNLKGADKELFNAITDTKHHVTINAIQQGNSGVTFGSSDGNHTGTHTLAFDQAALLDAPKNAGGMTSHQLVGHETLEGYYESKGKGLRASHNAANGFFPGFDLPTSSTPGQRTATDLLSEYVELPVHGTGVTEIVEFRYDTPIPIQSINNGTAQRTPGVPVDVRRKP